MCDEEFAKRLINVIEGDHNRRHRTNLLSNPDFEADWSEEESHDVAILRPGEDADLTERGNIFTPPGWLERRT